MPYEDVDYWIIEHHRQRYKVKIRDLEHLADRIGEAWAKLRQDFIDKTINSFIKRVKAYIDANGGHFEYLLK